MGAKDNKEYQSIFNQPYFFRGAHAEKLIALMSQFGDSASIKMFQRNVDVFMVAPIIGFIYGRKAELNNGQLDRTINFAQMVSCKNDILFNYRLVMLLDKEYEPDSSKRLDKAFRYFCTPKAEQDEKRYEEYMRGGIEILYEKLIQPGNNYSKNLIDFLEEFNDRYATSTDGINLVDIAHSAQ